MSVTRKIEIARFCKHTMIWVLRIISVFYQLEVADVELNKKYYNMTDNISCLYSYKCLILG